MEKEKITIDILPNYFLDEKGIFKCDEAIMLCGKIAGVCYDKEGFKHLENEEERKTLRRVDMTLNNGHHSVYDHITINFNLHNVPKILAMILNNEHEYTTSEKSARYTPVVRKTGSVISEKEEILYNKWLEIFQSKIKESYGDIYGDSKILKLAQENARYLVTVFMPTEMIYSTSLRQINYLASWMEDYIKNAQTDFTKKISDAMQEFLSELKRLNILVPGLMTNEKNRKFSLFTTDIANKEEHFGNVYATKYKATFAELAQAQRHRTIDYQMEILETKEYFIPPIIESDNNLVQEWLKDIASVKDIYPIGELILIYEVGKYEDFILKCKERLCSAAQLEIRMQTRDTLLKYLMFLEKNNNILKDDIKNYTKAARCSFKDFKCSQDCNFKEGKLLTSKI